MFRLLITSVLYMWKNVERFGGERNWKEGHYEKALKDIDEKNALNIDKFIGEQIKEESILNYQ